MQPPWPNRTCSDSTKIAQRLGISKSRARQLADSRSFPEGLRLHQGRVWSAEDVEAWIARYRPQQADGGQDS